MWFSRKRNCFQNFLYIAFILYYYSKEFKKLLKIILIFLLFHFESASLLLNVYVLLKVHFSPWSDNLKLFFLSKLYYKLNPQILFLIFIYWFEREGKRKKDLLFHLFIYSLGCSYMRPDIGPAALAYQGDALTSRATQPGLLSPQVFFSRWELCAPKVSRGGTNYCRALAVIYF